MATKPLPPETTNVQMRGSKAEQMLWALAWFDRPVLPRDIAAGLDLSPATIRRGLQVLQLLGFASAGPRTREGRLWSLTNTGATLAARFVKGPRS
jgi:DNA-binding IclR family transcriptional regulator